VGQTVELNEDGTRRPAPPRSFDPLIGQRLLHYEVIEVIGQGGMSVVYRGRDDVLGRDVAIKVLHPFLADKPECRARLAREARAVARLEHPNILKIFNYSGEPPTLNEREGDSEERTLGRHEGFLVCELVPGDTLKHFADRFDLRDAPEIGAAIVLRLCRALSHAHAQGVVHRDLKPENVMVRDDGALKLMDFGIAQVVDQKQLTVTGTLLGSPAHMAPECIEGYPADERSDLFSLGTVLYWLCTGALPFEATSPHALLKAIVEARPAPPQQSWPRVSDDIARVLEKAMARKPDERYATADEMGDDLEELLKAAGLPVDEESLQAILGNPRERLGEISATVREAYLSRARDLLDEGAQAKAFGALSRVLGEQPEDEDAQALLERAQDLEPDEPEEVEDETTETAEAPAPVEIEPRRGGVQRFALVAGALGLVAGVVVLSQVFDGGAPLDNPSVESGSDKPPARFVIRPAEGDAKPPAAEIKNISPVVQRSAAAAAALRARAKLVATERPLAVVIKPYADVFVDDKPVAQHAFRAELKLTAGQHALRFEHPAAKSKTVVLGVPRGDEAIAISSGDPATLKVTGDGAQLTVVLDQTKPALLRIEATPADALVSVDGQPKGTAAGSLATPIVVPFPDRVAEQSLNVTVYKAGYRVFTRKETLRAGRQNTVQVVLEPEPDARDNGDPNGDKRPILPTK
jgi:serine/threonine-protein kinase